ncbi:MoaD/ThiS family protein [Amphritea sp. HPY]|uniref:MoaD/ThiS family protein n=1 Tax=Amphritea sp. HPY TaxID=3421652 RepID=UPI003D7E4CA1
MINVLYFASLRETLGLAQSSHELTAGSSVAEFVDTLREQGDEWQQALSGQLLCSVNQEMVAMETILSDGDELALFPPVTGG